MSGSSSNLDLLGATDTSKESELNALFDAASPGMLWGRRSATTAGLTWGYFGGIYAPAVGAPQSIANGTVQLSAGNTNYLYADPTTGAVSASTSGFPTWCIPLYQVVTGAAFVTSYSDMRGCQPGAIGGTVAEFVNEGGGAQIYDVVNSTPRVALLKELYAPSGNAMTVADKGTYVVLNVSNGTVTGAANEGSGVGVLDSANSTSSTLEFKTLTAGPGVGLTDMGNGAISLSAPGSGLQSVYQNGSDVLDGPTILNFGAGFKVTSSSSGEADIALAYTGRGIADTIPTLSSFTQYNQIGATFTQNAWGIGMSAPSVGSFALAALMKAAPSTPYAVVMRLRGTPFSGTYPILAPCWSDGTKYHIFGYFFQNPLDYGIGQAASLTSFTTLEQKGPGALTMAEWLRLRDDGTNRYFDVSADGNAWYTMYTVSRTDYLTPTQVGVCFGTQGQAMAATLFSWSGA